MLHASSTDRRNKTESTNSVMLAEHERQKQKVNRSGRSPSILNHSNLTAIQQAYGNQSTLQMVRVQQQKSSVLKSMRGRVVQRKCACGNAAGAAGTCGECQSRHGLTLQTKLRVGAPGDKYEQEADRAAEQVMRMPEPQVERQMEDENGMVHTKPIGSQITSWVQRQVEEEEETVQTQSMESQTQRQIEREDEEGIVQRKETSDQALTVDPNVVTRIQSLKGGGQPLSKDTRNFFEPRFGYDFSKVRVHIDTESTSGLSARAYTIGTDIVFNSGRYQPRTHEGKQLLAHELTHVVQQQTQKSMKSVIQRKDTEFCERKQHEGVRVEFLRESGRCRYVREAKGVEPWKVSQAAGLSYKLLKKVFDQTKCKEKYIGAYTYKKSFYFDVKHKEIVEFGVLGSDKPFRCLVVKSESKKQQKEVDKSRPKSTPEKNDSLSDPVEVIRNNPNYLEHRVKGVNTFSGIRFNLEFNERGIATSSIKFPYSKLSIWSDPFEGNHELALTTKIYPSEAAAQKDIRSFNREGVIAYGFYRGINNIIFPTIISETTAPNLIASLKLSLQSDAEYGEAASKLLWEVLWLATAVRFPWRTTSGKQTVGRLTMQSGAKLTPGELVIVGKLLREGRIIKVLAESTRKGMRTADLIVDGLKVELKTVANLTGKDLSKALMHRLQEGIGQAPNIIADVRAQSGATYQVAERSIRRLFGAEKTMLARKEIMAIRIKSIRIIGKNFDIMIPFVP